MRVGLGVVGRCVREVRQSLDGTSECVLFRDGRRSDAPVLRPGRMATKEHSMHMRSLSVLLVLLAFCLPVHADDSKVPDFTLDVAAVPDTTGLPVVITDEDFDNKTPNLYAWDIFAWKTFAAMNWPAIEPTEHNGYLRGFPDLDQSFADIQGGEAGPLVWETLKEKREMFLHGAETPAEAHPGPWSSPYRYGADRRVPVGQHGKKVFSTAKFTTLDETVEVRAEVFAKEDKEYGSFGIGGFPVVARVFRGPPEVNQDKTAPKIPGNAVRYEVKVNYDFYKYVVDNGLYFDPAAQARSHERPPIQLPWRTSLPNPGFLYLTQKPAVTPYVQGYQAEQTLAAYRAGAQANDLPSGPNPNAAVPGDYRAPTPPRTGAIHLKAAWVPIEPTEKSRFITREAEFFVGEGKEPETALFGLIGLHIIQRIKVEARTNIVNDQPDHNLPPRGATGGTFIYSTWEHRDIQDGKDPYSPSTQYTYTNYFQTDPTNFDPIPNFNQPLLPVRRVFPILDHTHEVNKAVWSQLEDQHPGSVWTNYRLVGTQFSPVAPYRTLEIPDGPGKYKEEYMPGILEDPLEKLDLNDQDANAKYNNIGHQPAYLANLVIETNLGLQVFQGLPPSVSSVPQFSGSEGPGSSFQYQRDAHNVQFGAKPINTGGCMGCHAVAQLNGYSFSFVLLGGQAGAGPDAEFGTGFEAPLTKRRIGLLEAGTQVPLQSEALLRFVAPDDVNITAPASLESNPRYFEVVPADGRAPRSPFRYGDGVQFKVPALKLLPHDLPAKFLVTEDGDVAFVEQPQSPAVATWYLHNPQYPASTGEVLTRRQLAFRNADTGTFLAVDGDRITLAPHLDPDGLTTSWDTTSLFSSSVIRLQPRQPAGTEVPFTYTLGSTFTVRLADAPDSTRALRFGDIVNLKTDTGYLQETTGSSKTSCLGVKATNVNCDGKTGQGMEAWILVDFLHGDSEGLVERLTDVAFKNSKTGHLLYASTNQLLSAQVSNALIKNSTNEWNILPTVP